jgi:gamma-glutamyltranspeptidase/glutathione hydrolase
MHTIIPGMVTKASAEALMPYGVMGGHFQPMGQSLFLTNHFEYGLDIQQAIDLPRALPAQGQAGRSSAALPTDVVRPLTGHGPRRRSRWTSPHGGGQAICIDRQRGVLVGGSGPRKDGLALG